MGTGARTRMDDATLLTLSQMLSAAFPVGAFSYSHGLEQVIGQDAPLDAAGLQDWVGGVLEFGAPRNDVLLLLAAFRARSDGEVRAVNDLALALACSAERHEETQALGAAFSRTARQVWGVKIPASAVSGLVYPVAVGRAARLLNLPERAVAALFLQGVVANLVLIGVRLVPLGQGEGQQILARLSTMIGQMLPDLLRADLGQIGGCALLSDMAAMRHETMTERIFRT